MGRSRDFDVPNGQTESREDLPNCELLSNRLNSLRSPNSAHFLVFETGEDVREESGRPNCVIVGKNNDVGRNLFDSLDHLQALVCVGDGDDTDTLRVDGIGEFLEGAKHFLLGDNDDLLRLSNEPAPCGFLELLSGVDSRDDDGDILLGSVSGVFREGDRSVGERGGYSDKVPQISVEPERHQGGVNRWIWVQKLYNGTDPMTPKGTTEKQR